MISAVVMVVVVDEAEVLLSLLAVITRNESVTSAIPLVAVEFVTGVVEGKGLFVRADGEFGDTLRYAVVFTEAIPSFTVVPDAVAVGDAKVVPVVLSAVVRAVVVISTVGVVALARFGVVDSPFIVVGLLVSSLVGIFSFVLVTRIVVAAKVGVGGIRVELANLVVAVASVSDDVDNWDAVGDDGNLVVGTGEAGSGTLNVVVIVLGVVEAVTSCVVELDGVRL